VDKAARAGCVQVFIGMESVPRRQPARRGKPRTGQRIYRDMIACWHDAGVVCHVGYIIGFSVRYVRRVMEDVRTLRETLHVDQASFFMLAPIPGRATIRRPVRGGVALDPDYNNYDSFHANRAAPPHEQAGVGTRVPRRVGRVLLVRAHAAVVARPEPTPTGRFSKNLIGTGPE